MNRINLKELAELNTMKSLNKYGFHEKEFKLRKKLGEYGLNWFEAELNKNFEITVCDVNEDRLFENFYKSNIKLVEPYQLHVDMDLYEDIENDVVSAKYARSLGCMYFVQDNATYKVDVVAKKNDDKVDVMYNLMSITKIDDNEVPQKTPERFTIVYGYNTKDYYVYDEVEDVYYELDELLNEELKDRTMNEAREELIREDTSWFVEKNIFPEDCDL